MNFNNEKGRDHKGPRYTSLIHGENLVNVTIQGEGLNSVLDGQGEYWWNIHHSGNENYTRGHLLELMYSENIVVANLTLRNSPFWTNHFFDCDNVCMYCIRCIFSLRTFILYIHKSLNMNVCICISYFCMFFMSLSHMY
jgi:hypothetical protein